MTIAYFDCFNGAGGDMIVGSLIDAGANGDQLRESLQRLGLDGYTISIERTRKSGFAATRFGVQLDPAARQPARKLTDVVGLIERSSLNNASKRKAVDIFTSLATAEARVHGSRPNDVHFHEVGAVDAIMDIVGAVLAIEILNVGRVYCSPLPVGSGTIECEHGTLPVPAPATTELLKDVSIVGGSQTGELTTPTAAAVLTMLASGFGPPPPMTLKSVGYGAGARETGGLPNLLRVMLGHPPENRETDCATILETSIDDASPEVIGHCMERLLDAGALDVYAQPIHMKKWRCGVLLTVVCAPHQAEFMEQILFQETPTFGVRRSSVGRTKLRRRFETVATAFGCIRVKIGEQTGTATVSPEYEDCKAAAEKHRVPLREVIAAANTAWREKFRS